MASRRGKPNMTAAQEQTFLQLVTLTLYPAEAARHVDLTPQAISMRRKRDKAFDDRVRGAESKAMFALIARVQEGAKRDWRAAMALLERRWPELWARPEIRAELAAVNLNIEDVKRAFHAGLATLARAWAPAGARDEDDAPAPTADVDQDDDDSGPDVTRS